MVVRGGGPTADSARKNIIRIFNENDLKVTTETNVTSVDFLDVILDLRKNSTKPFIKPNSNTKHYVSTESSHPPVVIKSIPDGVSRRLSNISSSKDQFSQELPYYQEAMDRAGHRDKLVYKPKDNMVEAEPVKKRARGIIWFNPPWSSNIRTNIGGKFISLVKKHFPRSSPLYRIFNTKKIKVSYKTTSNMASVINTHNRRVLSSNKQVEGVRKGCNCRTGVANCPFNGSCLDKGMIYKAEVTSSWGSKHYYGQTSRTFKERYNNHQYDMRHHNQASSTTLSTYIWKIKDTGEEPMIKWSKVSSSQPYTLGMRSCPLCNAEKTAIAKDTSGLMLNRRREMMNRCLHKDPHKLTSHHTILPLPAANHLPPAILNHTAEENAQDMDVSVQTLVEETVQAEGADDAVVHQQPEPPDPGDEEPIPDPQDQGLGQIRRSRRNAKRRYSNFENL